MREVTDLFLADTEGYSETEREHFGAIMGRISKDMEVAVRRDLANTLAALPTAPHAIVYQLAHDEISVAEPVIAQSPVLEDDDLIDIANTKGQEYLEAIAGAPDGIACRLRRSGQQRQRHGARQAGFERRCGALA